MFSDTNFIAEQRADLPTNIKDIQSLYQKMTKLYIEHSENKNRMKVFAGTGNDSNLLIVFYVQIMPDDFVMQLHRF